VTRSLRRIHASAALVLALATPTILAVALAGRRGELAGSDAASPAPVPADAATTLESEDLWNGLRATTRIRIASDRRAFVEVALAAPVSAPDLLLYWSAIEPEGELPADAILVGALDSSRSTPYVLPPVAVGRDGVLVLYSLGNGEVVGTARLGSRNWGLGGSPR
jgi:hypothetical protein